MDSQYVEVVSLRSAMQSSFDVFLNNLFAIVFIVLVINLPINLIVEAIPVASEEGLSGLKTYYQVGNWLDLLIGTLSSLSIIHIAYAAHQERKLSINEAFRQSANNYMSAVWARFLFNIVIGIGLLLLAIPGLVIAVYWMFMLPQFVINGATGKDSLSASYRFVKGRWSKFAGRGAILLVLYIVTILLMGVISGVFSDTYFINVITRTLMNMVMACGLIVITELFLQSGGEINEAKSIEQ